MDGALISYWPINPFGDAIKAGWIGSGNNYHYRLRYVVQSNTCASRDRILVWLLTVSDRPQMTLMPSRNLVSPHYIFSFFSTVHSKKTWNQKIKDPSLKIWTERRKNENVTWCNFGCAIDHWGKFLRWLRTDRPWQNRDDKENLTLRSRCR